MPTSTWLLLGRALEEGTLIAAVGEGKSSDGADDMEDDRTEELMEREALVVEAVLIEAYPRVVCILAGPRENTRDGVEQHPRESKPMQQ